MTTGQVNLGFDAAQLTSLVERVRTDPAAGKTVWKASTAWRHGFQSEAIMPRKGTVHVVPMDEPTALGGSDTAPNMVEMVLGAYGCCLTTGFVAAAGLRGIELQGVEIELEGDLDLRVFFGLEDPETVSPGFTEVRAKVKLSAPGVDSQQLQALHDDVVRTSPVGGIIARPVAVKAELAES